MQGNDCCCCVGGEGSELSPLCSLKTPQEWLTLLYDITATTNTHCCVIFYVHFFLYRRQSFSAAADVVEGVVVVYSTIYHQ